MLTFLLFFKKCSAETLVLRRLPPEKRGAFVTSPLEAALHRAERCLDVQQAQPQAHDAHAQDTAAAEAVAEAPVADHDRDPGRPML